MGRRGEGEEGKEGEGEGTEVMSRGVRGRLTVDIGLEGRLAAETVSGEWHVAGGFGLGLLKKILVRMGNGFSSPGVSCGSARTIQMG